MLENFVNSLYANGGMPLILTGIVAILLGLLETFLGYRIFKIQVAIIAFIAGFGLGLSLMDATVGIVWLSIVVGILVGVLLCWLSMSIYKVGVFLVVGMWAFAFGFAIFLNLWFALAVGILVGLLGVFLTKPVIIISTSFGGGSMIGGGIATLIWGSTALVPSWLQLVVMIVFGVLGIIVQFRTTKNMPN